jgi:DeoR family fructose operon transcriptional repressor
MKSLAAGDRHARILDLLRQRGRMPVRALISALRWSPATVRRDLADLETAGAILRVHGGVLYPDALRGEEPHTLRTTEAVTAKRSIARAAAQLVPKGANIFIDAGTTCHELAVQLAGESGLTIYTNSASLFTLAPGVRCRLIFLGGECRAVSLALVGATTLDWIERLEFDIAFVGASAVHPQRGLYTTEPSEAGIKSAAMRHARKTILLADSSKLTKTAAVRFAVWNDVDTWVVEKRPTAKAPVALQVAANRSKV